MLSQVRQSIQLLLNVPPFPADNSVAKLGSGSFNIYLVVLTLHLKSMLYLFQLLSLKHFWVDEFANFYLFPLPRQSLAWQLPKIAPPQYPSLNLIEMLTIGGGGGGNGHGGTTLSSDLSCDKCIYTTDAASRVADCAVCPWFVRLPQN